MIIYYEGVIEEPLLNRIEQEVIRLTQSAASRDKKTVHMLDVGGNLGYLSLFAARLHPSVRVTVIEPFGWHADLLEKSIRLNGLQDRVKLFRVAVGDAEVGNLCMEANDKQNAASTKVTAGASAEGSLHCEQSVPRGTIDSVLRVSPFGANPDIVKMDIEGFEPLALKGAIKLYGGDSTSLPSLTITEWVPDRIWQHFKGVPSSVMPGGPLDRMECRELLGKLYTWHSDEESKKFHEFMMDPFNALYQCTFGAPGVHDCQEIRVACRTDMDVLDSVFPTSKFELTIAAESGTHSTVSMMQGLIFARTHSS